MILFAALVAVAVFCTYLLVDRVLDEKRRRDSLTARLAPDGSALSSQPPSDEQLIGLDRDPSQRARSIASFLRALGVNVDDSIRKLEPLFERAGIASPDAPYNYLFFQRIICIGLLMIAMLFLLSPSEEDRLLNIAMGAIIAVIALFGAPMWLKNKIDHRKKILQRAVPDTLDLLRICVESGLALDAALNRVCNELGRAYPEMTEELNRTRLELALINDRVRALMNLGDRTDMVQFRSLVAALIQSEKFGTSLTDTMRVLSEDFRLQRLTDAEAKAARLPVLMTIPLIFLLMPAFLLIVLGPAIVGFARGGSMVTGQ